MNRTFPTIRRGATGEVVEELHQLLAAAGFPVQGDPAALFGAATDETIRVLQRARNLQVDGICGPDTWNALCTPVYRLGDRLLARRKPNLRGDDVLRLQLQLGAVGFDPGRVDAIFGPDTERALISFQRDTGIPADGICGPGTLTTLARLSHLADGAISAVREMESLAATPRSSTGRRIFLACRPQLAQVVDAVEHAMSDIGILVATATDLSVDADAASAAHGFDADLSIFLQPMVTEEWRAAFYGSGRYRSFRGHAIAQRVAEALDHPEAFSSAVTALSTGFLRETRMPAVVVQLSDTERTDIGAISKRLTHGVTTGFEAPPELTD